MGTNTPRFGLGVPHFQDKRMMESRGRVVAENIWPYSLKFRLNSRMEARENACNKANKRNLQKKRKSNNM